MISEHTAANRVRSILRKTLVARTEPKLSWYAHSRRLVVCVSICTIWGMALYLIERGFAEQLDLTSECQADRGHQRRRGRQVAVLVPRARKNGALVCLYEAPSPDEILAAARRAGVPADVITEVNRFVPGAVG